MHGSPSPVVAEASAARLAILMALEKGWTHIHLEGDCLQVINTFKDRDVQGLRPFEIIVLACIELSSRFSRFTYSFVRRMSNCLAYAFAYLPLVDARSLHGVSPRAGLAHLL